MTDSNDDRPLSSDEMIKRARSDLDRRPGIEEMQAIDTDQIRQEIDEQMPAPEELGVAPAPRPRSAPQRPRRRVDRSDRTTPAGFGSGQEQSPSSIAIAVAMALLVIGAAAFLVLAASGAG